jgi:hypothetical protein
VTLRSIYYYKGGKGYREFLEFESNEYFPILREIGLNSDGRSEMLGAFWDIMHRAESADEIDSMLNVIGEVVKEKDVDIGCAVIVCLMDNKALGREGANQVIFKHWVKENKDLLKDLSDKISRLPEDAEKARVRQLGKKYIREELLPMANDIPKAK